MRLSQAMQINQRPAPTGSARRKLHLVCGFTPLHLATYLRAYARTRFSGDDVEVVTGLYGDIEDGLRTARGGTSEGAVVVLEWSDLDARLGLRSAAGWSAAVLADIARQAPERLRHLESLILNLSQSVSVALVAPTLPLPPLTHLPPAQAGVFELSLRAALALFLERAAASSRVRIAAEDALARGSPAAGRHDVQLDLRADFPYTLAHAAVASLAVECLFPPVRAKGLITDLDDTLWQGILGDAGAAGVAWSLDAHAQPHALYQELLASLAEAGTLIAVASKNDPALVEDAFARPDLLLRRTQVFPLAAGWGAKSQSVARILQAWNIGAGSVVFVDDSPMELAEVGESFPAIECLRFPSGDAAGVLDLIHRLRARFGAAEVREEDRLRVRSLSASAAFAGERAAHTGDFQARLEARLTLEFSTAADDGRALELVNKTNQFNLNGRRFSEAEWRSLFQQPGAFLLTAAYEDRFGPLGKIAALAGRCTGGPAEAEVEVDSWVLSCRAFSRQIEFQMLRCLLEKYRARGIALCFRPTPRNGPLQEFLGRLFPAGSLEGRLSLSAAGFAAHCPVMFHQVITKNG